jgi:hypothetical protein
MYMTAYLAAILTIAGLATLWACIVAKTRMRRVMTGLLGGLALMMGAFLIVSLVYFRPTTCRVLGGFMTMRGHCTSEVGGGGDNG